MTKSVQAQDIITLVKTIGEAIRADTPGFETMPEINQNLEIFKFFRDDDNQLYKALSADPTLSQLLQGWIQIPDMGMALQSHTFSYFLTRTFLQGKDVSAALSSARKFVESKSTIIDWYAPIAGIEVEETLSLSPDVELLPWTAVPASPHRDRFDLISNPLANSAVDFPRYAAKPTCVLRHSLRNHQILFRSKEDAPPLDVDERDTFNESVILCIVALYAKPSAVLGGWFQCDYDFVGSFFAGGYSWNKYLFDVRLSSSPQKVDAESFKIVFDQYQIFPTSDRKVLRVALSRMLSSLLETAAVDKAIDAGIALEGLLLKEMHGAERGELKYRTAIRGATFLGGSRETKLEIYKLIRAAYDLRSHAVHTGEMDKKTKDPSKIIDGTLNVCAAIARKLLANGAFPNWEKDFVLSGDG